MSNGLDPMDPMYDKLRAAHEDVKPVEGTDRVVNRDDEPEAFVPRGKGPLMGRFQMGMTPDFKAALDELGDKVSALLDAIAAQHATLELSEPITGEACSSCPVLLCAACIQDARNAAALDEPVLEVHLAATIINGLALCDVEGRHRIVTPAEMQRQQTSGLLIPQNGQIPPQFPGANGHPFSG